MSYTATEMQAMQLAIDAARQARTAGDTPFGATLVSPEGEILHTAPNRQNSTGDCTAHAEVVLVREAAQQLGADRLRHVQRCHVLGGYLTCGVCGQYAGYL